MLNLNYYREDDNGMMEINYSYDLNRESRFSDLLTILSCMELHVGISPTKDQFGHYDPAEDKDLFPRYTMKMAYESADKYITVFRRILPSDEGTPVCNLSFLYGNVKISPMDIDGNPIHDKEVIYDVETNMIRTPWEENLIYPSDVKEAMLDITMGLRVKHRELADKNRDEAKTAMIEAIGNYQDHYAPFRKGIDIDIPFHRTVILQGSLHDLHENINDFLYRLDMQLVADEIRNLQTKVTFIPNPNDIEAHYAVIEYSGYGGMPIGA